MARKKTQIIGRGTNTWFDRLYLGRDPKGEYHNQTIHRPVREAQITGGLDLKGFWRMSNRGHS